MALERDHQCAGFQAHSMPFERLDHDALACAGDLRSIIEVDEDMLFQDEQTLVGILPMPGALERSPPAWMMTSPLVDPSSAWRQSGGAVGSTTASNAAGSCSRFPTSDLRSRPC
jgi:hypothetical protein